MVQKIPNETFLRITRYLLEFSVVKTQNHVAAISSSFVCSGAVKMPMGIVGTLSGGAIMGRLKLNLRGASVMVLVIALLSAGCLIANFFIGCETRKVASITADVNER